MKVVINSCFGAFSLSEAAMERYRQYGGTEEHDCDIPRQDPSLIRVVEEMGEAADGRRASLKIVEVPDDVAWHIDEYDGCERVAENHRTWE